MKHRLLALLLAVCILLSFTACKTQESEPTTTAPTTEAPTEPTTQAPVLTAHEHYAQAVEALKAKDNVTMEFNVREQHTVWNDSFLCTTRGTAVFEGLQKELLAKVEGDISFNRAKSIDYSELYVDGASYAVFDGAKHQDKVTQEDYLDRQYPVCLFDAENFEEGLVWDTPEGTRLTFSKAKAAEEWVAPEYAVLTEATAELFMTENGIESMSYSVSYRQGAADITMSIDTTLQTDCEATLSAEAPKDQKDYILLDYSFTPQLIARAISNFNASDDRSGQIIQITASQAAAVAHYNIMGTDACNKSGKQIVKVDTNGTIYTSEGSQPYSLLETFKDGTLTVTQDGTSKTQYISDTSMKSWLTNSFGGYFPEAEWISSAKISAVGNGLLLEMEYDTKNGKEYFKDSTALAILGRGHKLDEVSTEFTTNKLTAYMGIDTDTWLPTSYGFDYEMAHTIEGDPYILSQQYYSKLKGSNPDSWTAVSEEPREEVEPETPATPLFYHVTGVDGSEMWLLGTIHIGDDRTAFLPQEIYDAFDASDALAVEYNLNAYDEEIAANEDYQDQIADLYFYDDESTIQDHLDEDVYEAAVKYLKYCGDYNPNMEYTKPFVWESAISQFLNDGGRRLFSEKGVDQRFLDLAEEKEKEILDVESAEAQITMMAEFSEDLQQVLLVSAMSSSASKYNDSTYELYELWCAGDEAALIKYLREDAMADEEEQEEMDEEIVKLYEEYTAAMSTERDIDMLAIAKDYLRSGKTVFYAVGLAHLLAEDGLVEGLRAAGYTVELVEYKK